MDCNFQMRLSIRCLISNQYMSWWTHITINFHGLLHLRKSVSNRRARSPDRPLLHERRVKCRVSSPSLVMSSMPSESASNRIHAHLTATYQVSYCFAPTLVLQCRDVSTRLIEHEIYLFFRSAAACRLKILSLTGSARSPNSALCPLTVTAPALFISSAAHANTTLPAPLLFEFVLSYTLHSFSFIIFHLYNFPSSSVPKPNNPPTYFSQPIRKPCFGEAAQYPCSYVREDSVRDASRADIESHRNNPLVPAGAYTNRLPRYAVLIVRSSVQAKPLRFGQHREPPTPFHWSPPTTSPLSCRMTGLISCKCSV